MHFPITAAIKIVDRMDVPNLDVEGWERGTAASVKKASECASLHRVAPRLPRRPDWTAATTATRLLDRTGSAGVGAAGRRRAKNIRRSQQVTCTTQATASLAWVGPQHLAPAIHHHSTQYYTAPPLVLGCREAQGAAEGPGPCTSTYPRVHTCPDTPRWTAGDPDPL